MTEKREGLEVRGYEVRLPSRDAEGCPSKTPVVRGADWRPHNRADPPPHYPLVRLSDAQAEVARAREEGLAAEIRGAVEFMERLQDAGYYLHDQHGTVITAPEFLGAVLAALPSPPEGGGG